MDKKQQRLMEKTRWVKKTHIRSSSRPDMFKNKWDKNNILGK